MWHHLNLRRTHWFCYSINNSSRCQCDKWSEKEELLSKARSHHPSQIKKKKIWTETHRLQLPWKPADKQGARALNCTCILQEVPYYGESSKQLSKDRSTQCSKPGSHLVDSKHISVLSAFSLKDPGSCFSAMLNTFATETLHPVCETSYVLYRFIVNNASEYLLTTQTFPLTIAKQFPGGSFRLCLLYNRKYVMNENRYSEAAVKSMLCLWDKQDCTEKGAANLLTPHRCSTTIYIAAS